MNEEDLSGALRDWYARPFARDVSPCDQGPTFMAMVEWVKQGQGLTADAVLHIDTCERCRRVVTAIRRELVGESAALLEAHKGAVGVAGRGERPARLALRERLHLNAWRYAGLAAAASIGIVLLIVLTRTGSGPARAFDLREIGYAPPIPFASLWPDPADQAALDKARVSVEEARSELSLALNPAGEAADDPWIPWVKLYRNLRAMGMWEEALAEAHDFVDYARARDEQPERYSMYYSGLYDLGNLYLALGDYDRALDLHEQSYAEALDYQEWLFQSAPPDESCPHALERDLANTFPPRLWTLSRIASAQEDRQAAWDYHNQAGEFLLDFFRKECAFRGLEVDVDSSRAAGGMESRPVGSPRGDALQSRERELADPSNEAFQSRERELADPASDEGVPSRERKRPDSNDSAPEPREPKHAILELAALCRAVVEDGDASPVSPISKVREHLLNRACLLRVDRELDAAETALNLGATLPYIPLADESRLDFNEPMERLRIAIARGYFEQALIDADDAAQHTGSLPLTDLQGRDVSKPPIGLIARAELKLLRGVALANSDPTDQSKQNEARKSVQSALDAVGQLVHAFSPTERRAVLRHFHHWFDANTELARTRVTDHK